MTLVFLNVYVLGFAFYLQKPKISETAVQLKQHQLDNSNFPSGETRENSLHKALCLLFLHRDLCEQGSHSKAVHSHTGKEDIEFCFFAFWIFCFISFCFLWPSMFQLVWPAEVSSCKSTLLGRVSAAGHCAHLWMTGHCSTHLVRW